MVKNQISDRRAAKAFRGLTFSGYKKSAAKTELLNSIRRGLLEEACYWSAEYVCGGHTNDLWEIVMEYMAKYIHLANPSLPHYLEVRRRSFEEVAGSVGTKLHLTLRNNAKVRDIFAEVICVLCLSKKQHAFTPIKIKAEDFTATYISSHVRAPNRQYIGSVFKTNDPPELLVPSNELAYTISCASKDSARACYWAEWMLEYERRCKKIKDTSFTCANRRFIKGQTALACGVVWLIWNIILKEAASRDGHQLAIIRSLIYLFTTNYKKGSVIRRRMLIYFAISTLTESFDASLTLYSDKKTIEDVIAHIALIYGQVKTNEIRPKTDYLFKGLIPTTDD